MTADAYLSRSRLFRRLKCGPHGQLVEDYAARLIKDGLSRHGTWRSLSLLGDLMGWVASSGSMLTDLDEGMVEQYLRHRAGKQSIQPGDRAALKRLLSVLREACTIAPAPPPALTPHDQIFKAFSHYLQSERGLATKSIVRHLPVIASSCARCALPAPATSAGSVRRTSPATSSAMPGIGARSPGRRCAGRCAHFSDTSIIKG